MSAAAAGADKGGCAQDGLPVPRRYWAVATLLSSMSLAVVDASIANVALPTIAMDLDAPASQAVWVANAYSVSVVIMLLPMSALAERWGFRRMYAFGVLLFLLASLCCALASDLLQLSLARVAQGVGAATLMCMFGGFVRNIYPLRLLGRGISINATTVALSSVLGPALGSLILSVASWRWIFAVNVPIGLLVLLGIRFLPDVPRNNNRLDVFSAVLSMVTLGTFISGVNSMGHDIVRGVLLIAVSVVAGVLLVRRARGQTAPLVPVDLLRIKKVAYAVSASACTFAAQMAAYVALPFYFQQELGRPYLEIGLLMAAWPLGTAVVAPVAGRLSDRYMAATLAGIGAGIMMLGLLWLTLLPQQAGNAWIMVGMFITGVGFGLFQTPNNRDMLSAAPRQRSGAAGGLQATTRVFGQSFGTALVAIAFSLPTQHGATLALLLGAVCAGAAVTVNTVRFSKQRGKAA